jgi:tRNA pseudouridine13 synthase
VATFRSSIETFVVEEVPAYEPVGVGAHTYLWIEKRGLTTLDAIRRIARALRVKDRDVGYAGLKDKHATTRQWLSVPDVPPETAAALALPDLRVLDARRHGNKLRLGHLRGNRFEVVLEDVRAGERERIEEALRGFAREGLPNRYGDQRFGSSGDNVAVGLAVLRGERREPDGRRRRLLLSAVQSAVFNETLARRAARGGLRRVRAGDVLQKVGSGGLFVCTDVAVDQARVDAGEIVPTGPMPGSREVAPPPGSEAAALEAEALAAVGVTAEELAAVGRDLPGARRPVVVAVTLGDPPVADEAGRLRLRFSLPAGSYATVLLAGLDDVASLGPGAGAPGGPGADGPGGPEADGPGGPGADAP